MSQIDRSDDGLTTFYLDIRSSFSLAMRSAGIDAPIRKEILTTVDDYVDNEYSFDMAAEGKE